MNLTLFSGLTDLSITLEFKVHLTFPDKIAITVKHFDLVILSVN